MTDSYVAERRSRLGLVRLVLWRLIGQPLLFWAPLPLFWMRSGILRLFGASISSGSRIYPFVRVWDPRNLSIGRSVGIGRSVYIYNKASVSIDSYSVVSAEAFLCTAGHEFDSPGFELLAKPISIGSYVWIASRVIVLPGVEVAEGSVIGAGSVLARSSSPWSVYAGNPAKLLRPRTRFLAPIRC